MLFINQHLNTLIEYQTENLLITLILLRFCNSLFYLSSNSITHSLGLPYALANALRLLGSILDLAVLVILLFNYIFEWCKYAYSGTIIDIGALFLISGLHWAILVRQKRQVQPVFIIGVMTMLLFLVVSLASDYTGALQLQLPALLLYFGGYNCSWLVFHFYEKEIVAFIESAAEELSWVDRLIGSIPHSELALRNTCSFSLGLVNLMYVYTSIGGAVNIITASLIGLSLITSVLIGFRLIKTSAFVKLDTSFMLQIVKQGYSNITTIYGQLKNKQLPKTTWYGWVIALMMGVTLISPAYAADISTDGTSTMGLSGSGSQLFGTGEGEEVSEGTAGSRLRQGAQRLYEHTARRLEDRAMNAPADALIAGGTAAAGYVAGQSQQTNQQPIASEPTELESATERANSEAARANS
uniref:Uncharacterized protein n=1 Tax=Ulva flexuosa TaxID=83791 RepID=A0A3S6P8W3_9CHLO|nr:hypothetical protein [Ulva flexuosa]